MNPIDSTAEWIEADGLGGFASGTVSGIRSRRYHALLLTATTPPAGRVVLVNGFDAWVETPAGTFALSSQRYAPDVIDPDGASRIESFEYEPWPKWRDHARSRAYRWGEDGLLGITDRQCRLCFALALWNGRDPILKERLFGLTGSEGNHGEDVKELYYYLDSTPTHSYMNALYKYPQTEFPYRELVEENRRRGLGATEFELIDTGAFAEDRYFNVLAEYAKADEDDILIRLTIVNRGPEKATLHLLPTLWFRNTWSWGPVPEECTTRPSITLERDGLVRARHDVLGEYELAYERRGHSAFTDNETNAMRLYGYVNSTAFAKDAFHECIIQVAPAL